MKKILFVSAYGGVPGGVSRWASHILNYYSKYGKNDVDITLVPMGRSSFVSITMPLGQRLKENIKDYTGIFNNFYKTLKKEKFDILHLASSGSLSVFKDWLMIRAAKKRKMKTIIHFHFGRFEDLFYKNNWEWKMIKVLCRKADRVIVLDRKSKSILEKAGFPNVQIIPNPIAPDIDKYLENHENTKRQSRHILYVGHVLTTKGIFELMDACQNLKDMKLKLVGNITNDMRDNLITKYSGFNEWYFIDGEQPYDKVIEEMQKCDIMVLPSYTEGFPNVILEAMACGTPIVATKVGAIPEMLSAEEDNEAAGVLIEPQNSESIKDAINSLFLNQDFKNRIGITASKRVKERYSIDKVWNKLTNIWWNI